MSRLTDRFSTLVSSSLRLHLNFENIDENSSDENSSDENSSDENSI